MKQYRLKFLTFLLVTFSIIISIFICEFILRFIGLGDPVIYDKNPVWNYSLSENQNRIRFNNKAVRVNNVGLRSNKDWTDNNKTMVLFHGDSVTYGGSKLDNSELFSEKICQELSDNFICGNAGVNAYGILNMVMRSKYDDRIQDSNVVIFTIILQNFWRGLVDIKKLHYFTSKPNKFFPAIEESLNFISWKYDFNRYLGQKKNNSSNNNQDIENMIIKSTDFTLQILNDEILRLQSKNKKVFVFFSPTKKSLLNDQKEWIKKLKKKVLTNTLNIYDMSPNLKENLSKGIYFDNIHFNDKGHKIISEIIFKHIKDKLK